MSLVDIKRTIKQGVVTFWRNGWVSLATVLVMVIALFVVGVLFFSNVLLTSVLDRLEDKVDISVFFRTEASEEEILSLQSSLEKVGEVKIVTYTSREEALAQFKERHKENSLITQSLDELGDNPLGASLNIKANNPQQYNSISRFLESNTFSEIIDKIDYRENQLVIDRLTSILSASRTLGFGATLVSAIIAILVAFNTIRMAIYTSRDEISVMRLVGAGNSYIRAPFLIEGVIHGVIATILAMLIFWPITYWLGPKADRFFGGPNLFEYYVANLIWIFLIILVVGVVLGVVSSLIATRRYLNK